MNIIKYPNRVQDARILKGWSRDGLAQAVGITRQSVRLIETGEVCPSTMVALRIARVLSTSVEALFMDESSHLIDTRLLSQEVKMGFQPRVYVSELSGEWIARPAKYGEVDFLHEPVQGIAEIPEQTPDHLRVQLFQSSINVANTVFVSGCEIGLGLLSHYAGTRSATERAIWFNRSNRLALSDLEDGTAHVASIHYSPQHPVAFQGDQVHSFHFVSEEIGWILPFGNPKGFTGVEDLLSGKLRLVNREKGSGARDCLDTQLQGIGADLGKTPGYDVMVRGHLDVAAAVASGMADVGVAHSSAAAALGLSFIPIQPESCVLLIRDSLISKAPIQNFLEILMTDRFRKELQALAPYDTQKIGTQIQ